MLLKITLNIIFIGYLTSLSKSLSPCPPPEIVFPFVCNFEDPIVRGLEDTEGKVEFNITQLALNISEYYGDSVEDKYFTYLSFDNTYIKDFDENCLLDLTFRSITIQGNNAVERIHENAFHSSKDTLRRLSIYGYQLMALQSPYNIFNLINSLSLFQYLALIIPKEYEIIENSIHNFNLLTISLININTINNKIFYRLRKIRYISILGNFDYIPSNAFLVKNPDIINSLEIEIGGSQINGSSFGSGVFINPNRTIDILFWANRNLKTLKKNIFGELLHKHPKSIITTFANSYNCNDCDFKWIFERKSQFISQLRYAECSDGRDFYNLTINDFNHCSPNETSSTTTTPISTTSTTTTIQITTSTPTFTTIDGSSGCSLSAKFWFLVLVVGYQTFTEH